MKCTTVLNCFWRATNHKCWWKYHLHYCTFGWVRVNVLHSSSQGAMFWTQGCFSYCWTVITQHQAFSVSHPTPPASRLGVHRSWDGTQTGQLTPTDQRDIPYHMTLCSAYKARGKRRKGVRSEWWRLSSQAAIMHDEALLSWKGLNICLPMESSAWILYFALLVRTAFALSIKLSSSQSMNFHTFTLLILSLIPLGGRK